MEPVAKLLTVLYSCNYFIIIIFILFYCRPEKCHFRGRRRLLFSAQQEELIIDMVLKDKAIKLKDIKKRIIEDDANFRGINNVSLSTIDRVLHRNSKLLRHLRKS